MNRFGASPEEWRHFAHTLGLVVDLLPCVSNPSAVVSPDSSLKALGKVPSRYNGQRHAAGIKGWTGDYSSHAQVRMWSIEPDYGICVQTRRVRAIDIDCDDPEDRAWVEARLFDELGLLPCRRRHGSERRLYAFVCLTPLDKRAVAVGDGMVELLGDGQQFVAAGTHPSGERYEWCGGLPAELPVVPRETLDSFWAALGGELNEKRSKSVVVAEGGVNGHAFGNLPPDAVLDYLRAGQWVTWEPHKTTEATGIVCPWTIDHTSDSSATATVYWRPGTGGYAQGHFKCLHAHCESRTDSEFLRAIGYAASEFEVVAVPAQEPLPEAQSPAVVSDASPTALWRSHEPGRGLVAGKKGFVATLSNLQRALDTHGFWLRLGFDTFSSGIVCSHWEDPIGEEDWQPFTDEQMVAGRVALERNGFEPVGRELMRDAVELVARRRTFDVLELWLTTLKWDGVPRVDRFLQTYYCAEDTDYVRAVNRYWWSALAGRAVCPGVQADMVPILVGDQGLRKTRGIESIAPWPEAYTTVDLSARDTDMLRRMRGCAVWELNELRGLHTRERTAINSFITERADRWVPKYREFALTLKRRGIFIGTTNDDEFLDDETGNRRWLPVRVFSGAQVTAADRNQLWAEGLAIFLSEGVVWQQAQELARAEHADYLVGDMWEGEVRQWIEDAFGAPFTLRDLALGVGLDPRQIGRSAEMRLAKLAKLANCRPYRVHEDGQRKRLWKSRT